MDAKRKWHTAAKILEGITAAILIAGFVYGQTGVYEVMMPVLVHKIATVIWLSSPVVACGWAFCERRARGRRDWWVEAVMGVLLAAAAVLFFMMGVLPRAGEPRTLRFLLLMLNVPYFLWVFGGMFLAAMFPWPLAAVLALLVCGAYVWRNRHAKEQ